MVLKDFHIHSTFSDGVCTPEEIINFAIDKGMSEIGISDHSYTFFDEYPCKNMKDVDTYIETISKLKEKYSSKIKISCGIEQEYYSGKADERFDYVIGSLHYLKLNGEYVCIDFGVDKLKKAVDDYFGGDFYALIERYFSTISDIVEITNANIIGHFDIIAKYNEKYHLFDESGERYKAAWKAAADKLLKTGATFEINTGAMSRGHRSQPYPSKEILDYLADNGAKFILSSDSHKTETICAYFDEFDLK